MFTEHQFNVSPLQNQSAKTVEEHLKLYAGYVKHANLIQEKLASYQGDETRVYDIGELYRRFSFEYNGIRNHEIYFALLSGEADTDAPLLISAIEAQWGSLEAWKTAFTTLALTRGIGWAMLSYDLGTASLIMHWVDEQHLGQLQGAAPIIALDLWEHSYVADYQPSGKKSYITAFMGAMRWSVAEASYTTATRAR